MTLANIRSALRAHLLDDAAIAAVVGARVYPLKMPQGQTGTSIVYSRISNSGDHHMEGPSGLSSPRMQIDCWSTNPDTAASLADLVKERIDGFRGEIGYGGDSPSNRVRVQGVFFDSEREDYDSDVQMYRVSRDYFIWFEER